MNHTTLQLPARAVKPRQTGLTMMIDSGLPLWNFIDIVSSGAEYIDFVKFGWGTAVVTGNIDAKIDVLRQHASGSTSVARSSRNSSCRTGSTISGNSAPGTGASTSRCRTGRSR